MASFRGQDLVSGALKVALQKVQKHSTFLNSKQLSKKERRKEKKKQRKLLRKYGAIKYNQLINKFDTSTTLESHANNESNTNTPANIVKEEVQEKPTEILYGAQKLLTNGTEAKDLIKLNLSNSDSDLTDDECDAINPLKLLEDAIEFTTEGPQISEFAVALQDRYPCLNPEKPKTDTRVDEPLISFSEVKSEISKHYSPMKKQSNGSNHLSSENVIKAELDCDHAPKENRSKYLELLQNRDSAKKELALSPLKKNKMGEEVAYKKIDKILSPSKTDAVSVPLNAVSLKSSSLTIENGKSDCLTSSSASKISAAPSTPSVKRLSSESSDSKISPLKKPKTGAEAEKVSANPQVKSISPASVSPAKIKQPVSAELPVPKVILFKREEIKPGWRNRFNAGVGLVNLGNTCYLNSTLQVLLHTPALVNWLVEDRITGQHYAQCIRKAQTQYTHQCTICPMESLVSAVYNQKDPIRPHVIHGKLKAIGKTLSYGRQEDAHEFLRLLLESMERSYLTVVGGTRLDSRSKETTPLGQIFGGYTRGEVRCLTCRHVSTTFHPHAELQLDIRQVSSVQEGLRFYFQKEKLNNDYKCEKCKTFQPATKQQFMELAPVVLCIQLKRFRMDGSKMKKPIQVDPILNLRPHMHDKSREMNYRLVGVVNHMGSSPNCGHYTAIAQAQNGQFYNFDDSYVNPCGIKRIPESDVYVIIYEVVNRETSTGNSNGYVAPNVKSLASVHHVSNGVHKPVLNGFKISSLGSPGFKIPRRVETPSVSQASSNKVFNGEHSSEGPDSKSTNSSNKSMTHRFLDRNSPSLHPANKTVNGSVNGHNISSEKRNDLNGTKPLSKLPVPQVVMKSTSSPLTAPHVQESSTTKSLSPLCKESKEGATRSMSPLPTPNKQTVHEMPSKKLLQTKLPFSPVTPAITSWDGNKSTLGSLMELDRKRPFQKSREELEDEAIDAGRAKKIKKPIEFRSSYKGWGPPRSNPFDRVNDPSRR